MATRTPKPVGRLGRERRCDKSNTVGNHSFCTVKLYNGVIDIRPLFIRMASCEEVRNQLLISHDEGVKRSRD